jgi:hypothetical protein
MPDRSADAALICVAALCITCSLGFFVREYSPDALCASFIVPLGHVMFDAPLFLFLSAMFTGLLIMCCVPPDRWYTVV